MILFNSDTFIYYPIYRVQRVTSENSPKMYDLPAMIWYKVWNVLKIIILKWYQKVLKVYPEIVASKGKWVCTLKLVKKVHISLKKKGNSFAEKCMFKPFF